MAHRSEQIASRFPRRLQPVPSHEEKFDGEDPAKD